MTPSVHAGHDAIFAIPEMRGEFATITDLRILHNWSSRLVQVIQSNMGWDDETPVGTRAWYGIYNIGILPLNQRWDALTRVEWFKDVNGTRTGFDTDYAQVTGGVNWHPNPWLEVRPEIRGDFAGETVYGPAGAPTNDSQLTAAMCALIKF